MLRDCLRAISGPGLLCVYVSEYTAVTPLRGVDPELTRGCALGPPARLQPVDKYIVINNLPYLVINRVEGSDLGADVTKRW